MKSFMVQKESRGEKVELSRKTESPAVCPYTAKRQRAVLHGVSVHLNSLQPPRIEA